MNQIGLGLKSMGLGLWGVLSGLFALAFVIVFQLLMLIKRALMAIFGFNPKAKFIMVRLTALTCIMGLFWVPTTMLWVAKDPVRASIVMTEAGLGAMTLYNDVHVTKEAIYDAYVPDKLKEVSKRYHLGNVRRVATEPMGLEKPTLGYRIFRAMVKPIGMLTGGLLG